MKKSIILIISFAAAVLCSCNSPFLEREPKGTLVETNAFTSNENFRSYMYQCYSMFTDARILTNNSGTQYHQNGQYYSDHYSGLMTDRDLYRNPYAYQEVKPVVSSNVWDFSLIRTVNIMLSHLDDGYLTDSQVRHWRSVGFFFHSWWYMELVARYGDVPYVTKVLSEESPEAWEARTPRAEVVSNIISRLEYAIENIGDSSADGDNAVNADCCRAALSRFLLREGTWAKYHGLEDEDWHEMLRKCLAVSGELMKSYPSLYEGNGNDAYPAAGFDNEYTTESLKGVPGVIFYKQYEDGTLTHRFSDYVHIAAHTTDAPQATIDLYLMQNGRPVANVDSGYKGGKGHDLWDVYEGRDPRLPITFEPPVQAKIKTFANPDNLLTFKQWTFWSVGEDLNGKGKHTVSYEDSLKFRRYIDWFGPNLMCYDGGGVPALGSKRLPAHNHTSSMSHSSPNISRYCQTDNYMRCLTGYYFWKSYTSWEKGLNKPYQSSDKPVFLLSEVLLNYAEAAFELGEFDQTVADNTINKLRARSGVAPMNVSLIDENWDPDRDKGDASWLKGYDSKTCYPVEPVLWEIRRERLVELMGSGMSFYDVKRWHKAPYFINRQPCGAFVTAKDLPYGTGEYTGQFVDYYAIRTRGYADPMPNSEGQGWIYTYEGPLAVGAGWLDKYYLEQVPLDQIRLNPNLTQNPGY
ncbi:MAG: RagB/SusD family nutrient uptake outer membrane protein [Bacteroidales bacterium]|nr:RagB/SusD family nutrient uptake outer membrane protein [Bacteroidales bacterium]